MSNHVKGMWKVFKRQSRCQKRLRVNDTAADEIDSRTEGVQHRHRAQDRDLIIVDAARIGYTFPS